MMQVSDDRKAFFDIVRDFRFAILVSQSSGERLHGRPMSIAEIADDGTVYFSTSIKSGKVAEIQNDSDVLLTFQSRLQFAILEGVATVSRDRALIVRLWKQDWNVWYPGGKDDPSIAVICVTPTSGEYWDQSGLNGAKFLFQAVKAVVTGTQPQVGGEQHAKVEL
jgi:general stress protein 26